MKALILAAGKGERFFPFNAFRPKPMFPICNRPLLAWTVSRLIAAKITDIGIVVGHRGGRARNYFGHGRGFGCHISYIEQRESKGTAHAVGLAADFIGGDDVLVVFGDIFFGPDAIPRLLDVFKATTASGVAGVVLVDNLASHIRAHVERDRRVSSYTYKPRGGAGHALAGLYVFKNETLPDLDNTADFVPRTQYGIFPPEGREICDIIPLLYRENRALIAADLPGPWFDMDLPWHPKNVTRLALAEMAEALPESVIAPTATIDPTARVRGPISVGENTSIDRNTSIEGPVWIGKNAQIFEGSRIASHAVIGDHCKIGPFAKLSGTVDANCHLTYLAEFSGIMLEEGRVTHQIQLSGIFGERAEIGAGTQVGTLRFDDAEIEVEVQGIRRKAPGFTGVLFGDYSRTGIGAMIMPGRIVGPCAMVGPGVVLTKNAPPYKAVLVEQQLAEIDWLPNIYER